MNSARPDSGRKRGLSPDRIHLRRARSRAAARTPTTLVGRLVGETLKQNGKVIIPAFSVGRTQQIVYVLHELTCAGKLPRVPIFVDSPLSVNATDIYRKHPECFNDTIYDIPARTAKTRSAWATSPTSASAEESKKLNDRKEPMIIISASGMCEAGRIRHHLKNNIGDAKNLVLFIGYCAEGTLGNMITAGKTPVNIFGEPHDVRAKVVSLDTYSGHADKNELKTLRRETLRRPQKNRLHPRRGIAMPRPRRNPARDEAESRSHRAGIPAGGGDLSQ